VEWEFKFTLRFNFIAAIHPIKLANTDFWASTSKEKILSMDIQKGIFTKK
jgi:hypothetical protein